MLMYQGYDWSKQQNDKNKHHTCLCMILSTMVKQTLLLCCRKMSVLITCKRSNSPLDMVGVVALNAIHIIAKDEWRSGDEDDSRDGKHSKDTVPDCTSLFQEDPGQEGGKDWITEGSRLDNK